MSCPAQKPEEACQSGGSTAVLPSDFPALDQFIEGELRNYRARYSPYNWASERGLRENLARQYSHKVLNAVLRGKLSANHQAATLTNPEWARYCQEMLNTLQQDHVQMDAIKAETQSSKSYPAFTTFVRQVTGKSVRQLGREDDYHRISKIKDFYRDMISAAFWAGDLDYDEVRKIAGLKLAQKLMSEQVDKQAHTLRVDEYIQQAHLYNRRDERLLRLEHFDRVKKALEKGLDVPKEVLDEYPAMANLRRVSKRRLLPEDIIFTAARMLEYSDRNAYLQALRDRMAADYAEYARLGERIIRVKIPKIDRDFEAQAEKIGAHVRWAMGFSEEEIQRNVISPDRSKLAKQVWAACGPAFPFTSASAMRAFSKFIPHLDEFIQMQFKQMPIGILDLVFDKKGRPRPIYLLSKGLVEAEQLWVLDRGIVEDRIKNGEDVPLDIMLRYPDLIEKYGL